ncbi:hypothetical protein G6514_000471 [Epicoccum nigrum]|nr:hypothetical protein G6514_000471 [Epicoccum nigrum]
MPLPSSSNSAVNPTPTSTSTSRLGCPLRATDAIRQRATPHREEHVRPALEAEKQRVEADWQEDLRMAKAEMHRGEAEKQAMQRMAKAKKQRSEAEMPAAPDVLRAPPTAYKDLYGKRVEELSMWEKLKMLHTAKAKQRVELEKQRPARDRAESQAEREQTATE